MCIFNERKLRHLCKWELRGIKNAEWKMDSNKQKNHSPFLHQTHAFCFLLTDAVVSKLHQSRSSFRVFTSFPADTRTKYRPEG